MSQPRHRPGRIERDVTPCQRPLVSCEGTRLQLKPLLHWRIMPQSQPGSGRLLNIGEVLVALP